MHVAAWRASSTGPARLLTSPSTRESPRAADRSASRPTSRPWSATSRSPRPHPPAAASPRSLRTSPNASVSRRSSSAKPTCLTSPLSPSSSGAWVVRSRAWNRGAAELYGYSTDEALGQVTHELMRTIHPQPWALIENSLRKHGSWEGELSIAPRTVARSWCYPPPARRGKRRNRARP